MDRSQTSERVSGPLAGFEVAFRAEAREELRHRLTQVRERVTDAGLDPATVDEAIEAARKVS